MSFARYRGENTTENEPFFAIVPPPIMLMIIIRRYKVAAGSRGYLDAKRGGGRMRGHNRANHYYFVHLETSKSKAERDAAAKLTPIFPNQDDRGTGVNTSGGDMIASTPHKSIAIKFLEYMASDAARNIIANANYEFPAMASVSTTPEIKALGRFKIDPLNVSVYGENQTQAQVIFDRAGWR